MSLLLLAACGGCLLGCADSKSPQSPVDVPDRWSSSERAERPCEGRYGCREDERSRDVDGQLAATGAEAPTTAGGVDELAKPPAGAHDDVTVEGEPNWWTRFDDAELNRLVDAALQDSHRTRAAWARVARARHLAAQARAGQYPSLDAQLSGSRSRQVLNFPTGAALAPGSGAGGSQQVPDTFDSERYSATLEAGWEPDIFGRVGGSADAATFEAEAARAGVHDVSLGLASEVARAYFDWLEAETRRRLLRRQLDTSGSRLELIESMYERGLVPKLQLYQQRQQVAALTARIARLVGSRQLARARLAALTGQTPQKLRLARDAGELPAPPPVARLSVPAAVVRQRADVRAAHQKLKAADARVAAAVAERLPRLRLQGSIGFGGTEPEKTFDNVIWNAVVTVTQPIWHGGRIGAGADLAEAELEQRLADYADAVTQALVEVESALASLRRTRARLQALERHLEVARAALELAELNYQQGISDYLNVLDAERSLQQSELEWLAARRAALRAWVELRVALGGNWPKALEAPRDLEVEP